MGRRISDQPDAERGVEHLPPDDERGVEHEPPDTEQGVEQDAD